MKVWTRAPCWTDIIVIVLLENRDQSLVHSQTNYRFKRRLHLVIFNINNNQSIVTPIMNSIRPRLLQ